MRDLTIRLLGRPKVTGDSELGFQKVVRRYVVEGPRASKAGIENPNNPLFLPPGSVDEEFDDHYLVSQSIEPTTSTVDKAYLNREYVEIRNSWYSQQYGDQGEFETLTRKYVVLRAENVGSVSLGYASDKWLKHPANANNPNENPWDYIPKIVEDTTPTLSDYNAGGFNGFPWFQKNISVDHSKPGVDIWSATWLSPLRPIGRPKVTTDSVEGYQKVIRQFKVLRALADSGATPLHLNVGEVDPDFADHYLVDQQIEPSNSAEVSTLTRVYVEIRDACYSSSSSESGDIIRMTRKYAVLRANHSRGYSGVEWGNHPLNGGTNVTPWSILPDVIKNSEPEVNGPIFPNSGTTPAGFKPPMVPVNGLVIPGASVVNGQNSVSLSSALSFASTAGSLEIKWLRDKASVDVSKPGVDLWSVSWACPTSDYWTVGSGKRSGTGSAAPPSIFDFDHTGVKILRLGKSSTGGSVPVIAKTYVAFFCSDDPGLEMSTLFGGSGGSLVPAVSMDFHFVGVDGNHRVASFRQAMPNTWKTLDTTSGLKFPSTGTGVEAGQPKNDGSGQNWTQADELADNADITIATQTPRGYEFNYVHQKGDPYPLYQGQPIMRTGGRMDWTHVYYNSSASASIGGVSLAPIFSHGSEKIWKLKIQFIS